MWHLFLFYQPVRIPAMQIGFPCLVACSGYLSVPFLYLKADFQAIVVACEGRKGLQCGVVGGR